MMYHQVDHGKNGERGESRPQGFAVCIGTASSVHRHTLSDVAFRTCEHSLRAARHLGGPSIIAEEGESGGKETLASCQTTGPQPA